MPHIAGAHIGTRAAPTTREGTIVEPNRMIPRRPRPRSVPRFALGAAVLSLLACGSAPAQVWTAQWIWAEKPTRELSFRRAVHLPERPAGAWLVITADNIYTAWLNGEEIGRDDDWMTVETFEITDQLEPGDNVLAVAAVDPGPDAGGLLAEIILVQPDGRTDVVGTDETWRMTNAPDDGWTAPAFDDSAWLSPRLLGHPPVGPWGGLPHPRLGPEIPVVLRSVDIVSEPGGDGRPRVAVRARVERGSAFPLPARVGVLFRHGGETVLELWRDRPFDDGEWPAGRPVEMAWDAVRWPLHAPPGAYTIEVAGDNFRAAPEFAWTSPDPRPEAPASPMIRPASLHVADSDTSLVLTFTVELETDLGDGEIAAVLFEDDVLHEVVPLPRGRRLNDGRYEVIIPKDEIPRLERGTYRVTLLPVAAGRRAASAEIVFGNTQGPRAKPLGHGMFRDSFGHDHFWYVNRGHTLVWDGVPYYPSGGMYLSTFLGGYRPGAIGGNENAWLRDVERLTQLREAGVTDLYLNPCKAHRDAPTWVWQRLADLFEEQGFRYSWQITEPHYTGGEFKEGLLRPLKGFAGSRGSYPAWWDRPGQPVTTWIPSGYFGRTHPTNRVYAAAFAGETPLWIRRAAVEASSEGVRASVDIPADAPPRGAVLFVPELTFRGDMHDYWTSADEAWMHRFREFASRLRFGPGFRGFLDPLDNEQCFRDMPHLVPACAAFRNTFAAWLANRYHDLGALAEAWAIDPGPSSWETASRLVPAGAWPEESDIGWLFNEEDLGFSRIDLTTSQFWYDLIEFRSTSIRDFNMAAADALKTAHDAPVILKVTQSDTFTNNRRAGGFDAVGMEAYGTAPELTRGCGGGVFARAAQGHRTMWELVTETGRAAPGEHGVGYPTPVTLIRDLASMVRIGAKGVYIFYLNAGGDSPGASFHDFNLFMDPRQLRWLGVFGRVLREAPRLNDYLPVAHFAYPARRAGELRFHRRDIDHQNTEPHVSVQNGNGAWVVPVSDPEALPLDEDHWLVVNLERSPAVERFRDIDRIILGPDTPPTLWTGFRRDALGTLIVDAFYSSGIQTNADGRAVQEIRTPPGREPIVQLSTQHRPVVPASGAASRLEIDPRETWKTIAGTNDRLPAAPDEISFFLDVLGARILDLGPALEGLVLEPAGELLLWNLTDEPVDLVVRGVTPGDVQGALEATKEGTERSRITLPPRATHEVVLPADAENGLEGVNDLNLAILVPRLRALRQRAAELRIDAEAPGLPEPVRWREAVAEIDRWETRLWETENTAVAHRRDDVRIDGSLDEWTTMPPSGGFARRVGVDYAQDAEPLRGAHFWTAWNDEYLFVAARVEDAVVANANPHETLWNGDALEVGIEFVLEPERPGGDYDEDTCQFLFAPTSALGRPAWYLRPMEGRVPERDPADVKVQAYAKDMGWTLEAAIPWRRFSPTPPRRNAVLGFIVALDRSDGGDRQEQLLWRGESDFSRNRLSFARLRLAEPPETEP